jgi:small redox-active disulfide protein 2
MTIKILGSGCPNCQTLETNTKKAVEELGLKNVQIEHVHEINKIIEYGVMSTPAIVIDEKVKATGRILDVEEIKKILTEQKQKNNIPAGNGCSCGGKC